MDPVWLLLLLPAAAASGWIMAKRDKPATRSQANAVPVSFFKGLNLLLNEQPDKALAVFLEASEIDRDTVEMHIALGNLFRRRGDIERATQIHQNLVARTDLDESLRCLALYELSQDYFKAGLFDRAEGLLQELRQVGEFKEQACRYLLQIYDREREWHSAIVVAEELAQLSKQNFSGQLAQYSCELAERALEENKAGKAEYYLESAFRHDEHCVRATIIAGKIAASRGNHNRAISYWRKLEKWAPEALGEVVDLMAGSFEATGDPEGYRHFLENAIEQNPDARIISALVEITRNRGGRIAGQRLLLEIVKKQPNLEGLYQLLRNRNAPDLFQGESFDLELIAALLSQSMGQSREYQCRQCGFNSNNLHWQCPGCQAWGSVQKRQIIRERELRQSSTMASAIKKPAQA